MTSPFAHVPGIQKCGKFEFEWLPLLKTPCYGFNGPNACYSNTCTHNPSNKNQIRTKFPNKLPKFRLSSQTRKSISPISNVTNEYGSECSTSESSPTAFSCPCETNIKKNCCCSQESYCIEYGKISSCSSSDDQCSECTPERFQYKAKYAFNLKFCQHKKDYEAKQLVFESSDSGIESSACDCVSKKKHIFNPLSKPFEPKSKVAPTMMNYQATPMISNNDLEVALYSNHLNKCSRNYIEPPIEERVDEKTNEFPYLCILCPERHRTLDELQLHIRNKVEKPYNCIICPAVFKHRYSLYRHQNLHRILKTFICRGCRKEFKTFLHLKKHFEICRYKLYIFL